MANLRQIFGAGISGAGQSLAEALQEQAREKQAKEIQRRALLAASRKEDQDSENRIIEEVFKNNPRSAEAHVGLRRRNEDVAGPIAGDISKADSLNKALTDEDITSRFRSSGGRETLDSRNFDRSGAGLESTPNPGGLGQLAQILAQGKSRRASLQTEAEQPDRTIEETLPGGGKLTRGVNPRTMGAVKTGLSGTEQGSVDADRKLSGDLSPRVTDATATQQNSIERATRGGAVARAGAVAGAQEGARLNAQYDPKIVAAEIEKHKQLAIADAASAGNKENAVEAQKAAAASTVASIALKQIKDLYDKVKLGPGMVNTLKRAGRAAGSATGALSAFDTDSASLDQQAQAYSMLLYRAFGGTGANVSDTDIKKMEAGIPFSSTLSTVGDKVFTNSATMLTFNPMIKARYGNQPFEVQIKVVNAWMKLNDQARAKGVDQFEDPYKPGTYVPIVK